jgi:hypothetical protein
MLELNFCQCLTHSTICNGGKGQGKECSAASNGAKMDNLVSLLSLFISICHYVDNL